MKRIFTCHNTVLYFDKASLSLRHDKPDLAPANCWLVSSRGDLRLVIELDQLRVIEGFQSDGVPIICEGEQREACGGPSIIGEGFDFGVQFGELFLSANTDGSVALISHMLAWEMFHVRELCSLISEERGRPHRAQPQTGRMKIAIYSTSFNDGASLSEWIESTEGADYRMVGDLGSSDDTVLRLTGAGITVLRVAWKPSRLLEARHAVLSSIPEDVDICVWLEADEVLRPSWRSILESAWIPGTDRLHYDLTVHDPEVVGKTLIHARHVSPAAEEYGRSWRECILPNPLRQAVKGPETPIHFHNWWAPASTSELNRDLIFRYILRSKLGRFKSVHVFSVFGDPPKPKDDANALYVQFSGESYWHDPGLFDINLIPGQHPATANSVPFLFGIFYWNGGVGVDVRGVLPLRRRRASNATKFACIVISNRFAVERIDFFEALSRRKKVDSAGRHLCNVSVSAPGWYWDREYIEFLSQYRFVVCFENRRIPNYLTEKLINAYGAGCVPIYFGSDQASKFFNEHAFLSIEGDYSEATRDRLIERIMSLEEDAEGYKELYNQPLLHRDFNESEMSIERVADAIRRLPV